MTEFENKLIDKGYIKHILNCKTMKYEISHNHVISTMVNLDHRYIHKSDKVILKKIAQEKSVMDDDFTFNDRKKVICFGLHEFNKPPTLMSPRPRIEIKKIVNGNVIFENEKRDDNMNIVLKEKSFEEIFRAMFDNSLIIRIDLTIK